MGRRGLPFDLWTVSSPVLQVVAPTISSPVCQEQLVEAGKLVAKSVESCVDASQAATSDEQLLKQVGVAATAVTQALNDLLEHIKQHATGGQPIGRYDKATDTILNVTENIFSSMGDAGEGGGQGAGSLGWGATAANQAGGLVWLFLFQEKWYARLVSWLRQPLTW